MIEEFVRALRAALDSGVEVTVTLKKTDQKTQPGNHANNTVKCPNCNWEHSYTRANNARKGYEAHKKSCPGKKAVQPVAPQWLVDQTNGKEL